MKQTRFKLTALLIILSQSLFAQQATQLNLDSCFQLAKSNYPLVKQYALIDKSKAFSLENADKSYLPQINIAGQATYQSEVTKVPISLPNATIPEISKNQYKLYAEINQPITDLFTVKDQKEVIQTNAQIESQKIEIELYKLKDRIHQLYFGVLLIDAQIKQTDLLKKDIQTGIDRLKAALEGGIVLKSNVELLEAEWLKADQRTIELKANRRAFCDMLSLFIQIPIDENTQFAYPELPILTAAINRPELRLFELQKNVFDAQGKLLTAKNLPRFNFFLQSGIGRPALNMLSNDLKGYYIGGLRLQWNVTGLYTYNNEKQMLALNRSMVDLQKETFVFNTTLQLKQQNTEVEKLQDLLNSDNKIVALRENIKNTAKSQLQYGTTTTADYVTYINAEDVAKQSKLMHQIQLLMAQYNYLNTTGN